MQTIKRKRACDSMYLYPVPSTIYLNGDLSTCYAGQLPGVLGKGIQSRTFFTPVQAINNRSKPMPKPACGTVPCLRKSTYQSNPSCRLICLSFIACSNISTRSSRPLPPTISPTPGNKTSKAATVFPLSQSFLRM